MSKSALAYRPAWSMGSIGNLEVYLANLEEIRVEKKWRDEICQGFRELGNATIFCIQLEKVT